MKKLIVLLLSLTLVFTTVFSHVPYIVFAEGEEVTEGNSNEENGVSGFAETDSEENVSDPEPVIELQDDDDPDPDNPEPDLVGEYLTISQNPDSGNIIITVNENKLDAFGGGSDMYIYTADFWSYYIRYYEDTVDGFYYLKEYNEDNNPYFVIPYDVLVNCNIPSGDFYVEMSFNDGTGQYQYQRSNHLEIEAANLIDPQLTVSEIRTGDEKGIAIYADSNYLSAITNPAVPIGVYNNINNITLLVNHTGYLFENHDFESDNLVDYGGYILLTEESIKSRRIPNSDSEITFKFTAQGYKRKDITLPSLSIGCVDEDVDFQLAQDADGNVIISSENKEWLRALTIPTYSGDKYIQGSSIYLYDEEGSGYYGWHIGNTVYDSGDYHDETIQMIYDETADHVVVPYSTLIDDCIATGRHFVKADLTVFGYVGGSNKSVDFTIAKGTEDAPTDITLTELDNGNISINSNNKEWLRALAQYNSREFRAKSYLIINKNPEASDYYTFTYDDWNEDLIYNNETETVEVLNESLLMRGIMNGSHDVSIYVRGYLAADNLNIELKHATSLPPEDVVLSFENDSIIITSNDTDWINALYSYQNSRVYPYIAYIDIHNREMGAAYIIGAMSGKDNLDEFTISQDGKSIIIPKETVYKKKIIPGSYTVRFQVGGYTSLELLEQEIVTSLHPSLPEDISVVYDERGLVISSAEETWLDGIVTPKDVDKTGYVKLKLLSPYMDDAYAYFAGSENLLKEENAVIIPIEHISGYTIKNNYYVVVGSYGYRDYVVSNPIFIGDVNDVPLNLRISMNDEDGIDIFTYNTPFLNGLLNADSRISFYINGSEATDKDGLLIATGNAGSGTLAATFSGSDLSGSVGDNYLSISADKLAQKGVVPGRYEILLDVVGYCKGTSALTVSKSMVSITLNANGGMFSDGSVTKTVRAKANSVLSFDEPYNAGYAFSGWKDAQGNFAGEDYVATADAILYASWSKTDTIENSEGEPVEAVVIYDDTATGEVSNPSDSAVLIINTSTGTVIVPAGETATIPETDNALSATTDTQLYSVVDIDSDTITAITLKVEDGVSSQDQQLIIEHAGDEYKTENAVYFEAELQKQEAGDDPETVSLKEDTRIEITITLPDSILNTLEDGYDRVYKIIHVKEKGETETLNATVNGNQLTFITDSLSPFAVVYKDTKQIENVDSELADISYENTRIPGANTVVPTSYAFYFMDEGENVYTLRNDAARVVYSYCSYDGRNYSEFGFDVQIDKAILEKLLSDKSGADAKIFIRFSDSQQVYEYRASDLETYAYYNESNTYVPAGADYSIRLWVVNKSDIYDARILYNGELFSMQSHEYLDGSIRWYIIWNPEQQSYYDEFNTRIQNHENVDFTLEFNDSGVEKSIDSSEFTLANTHGIHGLICEYGPDNLFIVYDFGNSTIYDNVQSAYIKVNNETYYLKYSEAESYEKTTVYRLEEKPEEFEEDQIIYVEYLSGEETIKEEYYPYWNYVDGRNLYGVLVYYDHEVDGEIDSDYRFLFVLDAEPTNEEFSLISTKNMPRDAYELYHNENDNRYDWAFYVDPLDYYSDSNVTLNVLFKDNRKYSELVFEPIVEYQDQYVPRVEVGTDDDGTQLIAMELKGRNECNFMFAGKQDGEIVERQRHSFRLEAKPEDTIIYTYVSRFGGTSAHALYWYDFDSLGGFDENAGIFTRVNARIGIEGSASALASIIEGLDDTDHSEETFEEDYFMLSLKNGVEIVSKSYSLNRKSSSQTNPVITYVLSDGTVEEQLQVEIYDNDSIYDGELVIDGEPYNRMLVEHDGEMYTVYTLFDASMEADVILDSVGYDHKTILARTYYDRNDLETIYSEGHFYVPEHKHVIEVYYPSENYEITEDTTLNELNPITSFSEPKYFTVTDFYMGSVEAEAQNMMRQRMAYPVSYINEAGELVFITKKTLDENEFLNYTGDEPMLFYDHYLTTSGYYGGYVKMKTKKPVSFIVYNEFGAHESIDYDKAGAVINLTVPEGESGSQALEEAIASLDGYIDSRIVLTDDLSLDSDVLSRYFRLYEADERRSLVIDLNGYSIYTHGNKIELPFDSILQFVNTNDEQDSSIIGTGETVIKSYGRVIIDNLTIKNESGSGITLFNDSSGLDLPENSRIEAKTGIKLIERASGTFNQWFNPFMNLYGTIIAQDCCIYADVPTYRSKDTYNFYMDNSTRLESATGTAVYVNGYVSMNFYRSTIVAANGFNVNGGSYTIRGCEINVTNGDLFFVDSDSENARPTNITFNLDDMEADYHLSAAGAIVRNKMDNGKNMIEGVKALTPSGARVYFTYSELFDGVPVNVVKLDGGYYSSNEVINYIPESQYSADGSDGTKFHLETVDHNSRTYYHLVPPNDNSYVTNLDELRAALQNEYITYITFGNSIDAGSIGEQIDFTFEGRKCIDLNGFTLSNTCLNAYTVDLNEGDNDYGRLEIMNGIINNENSFAGIVLHGAKLNLFNDVSLTAGSSAIVLKNGLVQVDYGCSVKGNPAILVDIDNELDGYFGRIEVNGARIIGLGGPAIRTERTYLSDRGNMEAYFHNSEIAVYDEDSFSAEIADYNAVEIRGPVNLNIFDGTSVIAGLCGIWFDDNYHSSRYGRATVLNGSVESKKDAAVHLNDCGQLTVRDQSYLTGNTYAIEAYETSMLEIYSGWFYGGTQAIRYMDDLVQYRRQDVRGGYFSSMLTDRSINPEINNGYHFVCVQKNNLTDRYPYAIARQKNDINVYQIISNQINRNVSIDEDHLENAITEAERKALEEEGKKVDIIMTVEPETNEEFINQFPDDQDFKEFYSITINKNIDGVADEVKEVSGYQLIRFSINQISNNDETAFNDPNKIVIYHRHDVDDAVVMKKVSAEYGWLMREECYFITDDNYINIVTKRFSTFGFAENQEEVTPEEPKEDVSDILTDKLVEIYSDTYVVGKEPAIPEIVAINENELSTADDLNIVYEGTGETVYHSDSFPTEAGTYKVVWTINENEQITGSASKEFRIAVRDRLTAMATLSFSDSLNINFYVDNIAAENASLYTVKYRCEDIEHSVSLADLPYISGKGYRAVLANVYSYQMWLPVYISLEFNNGVETERLLSDYEYSVKKYLDNKIKDNKETESFKQLCRLTLDYGANAQIYFTGKTYGDGIEYVTDSENLVNAAYNPDNTIEAVRPVDYETKITTPLITGLKTMSASLIFGSTTSIKVRMGGLDMEGLTVTCVDDKNESHNVTELRTDSESNIVFSITGLKSFQLHRNYYITIKKGSEEMILTYSPYTYANKKWDNGDNEARLCQSMVAYGDAAKEYWND